jgi:hypothetical protein
MIELDVEITAGPEELREAIGHLGERERAVLHHLHEEIDIRDEPALAAVDRLR